MAINYEAWTDVSGAQIGSTSIYGVVSISVERAFSEVHASADNDSFEPVAERGVGSMRGTITLQDAYIAEGLDGLTGTLAYTATKAPVAGSRAVSISNVRIMGISHNVRHAAAAGATVEFLAFSSDGSTDPMTIT